MSRLVRSAPVFVSFIFISACNLIAQSKTPVEMASLRLSTGLAWQRVHPAAASGNNNGLEGAVLYQLLLNASGTPGTIPMFDTNPHHLINSPITVGANNVAIGGLSIDHSSGLITFAGGQTFPGTGTITNIATGTGLTGGPITSTGTVSIANGGVGTAQIASKAVTAALVGSGAASSTHVLTADGAGGAAWQPLPAATTTDTVYLPAATCVGSTGTPVWGGYPGNAPTFACYNSGQIQQGVAQMLANQGGTPETSWALPLNWDGGTVNARVKVLMPGATGALDLSVGSVCSADGAASPTSFSLIAQPLTSISDNFMHTFSLSLTTSGCHPGDLMYIVLVRLDSSGPPINFFGMQIQYGKK